jgi:hypothetical protein
VSENPRNEEVPDDDAQPLTGEPVGPAPMRLRGSARVTRLSRKVLAGVGLVASVGLGGALIYALQTRDAAAQEELYSTETARRLTGWRACRAITAAFLGSVRRFPAISAGRSSARERRTACSGPWHRDPNPGLSPEEQRRLQEIETARTSRLFSGSESRVGAPQQRRPSCLRRRQTSPASGSRRRRQRLRPRIVRTPSSMPRPIAGRWRPIESSRRRLRTFCKPAPSSRLRSSPEFVPIYLDRSRRRSPRTSTTARPGESFSCRRARASWASTTTACNSDRAACSWSGTG